MSTNVSTPDSPKFKGTFSLILLQAPLLTLVLLSILAKELLTSTWFLTKPRLLPHYPCTTTSPKTQPNCPNTRLKSSHTTYVTLTSTSLDPSKCQAPSCTRTRSPTMHTTWTSFQVTHSIRISTTCEEKLTMFRTYDGSYDNTVDPASAKLSKPEAEVILLIKLHSLWYSTDPL